MTNMDSKGVRYGTIYLNSLDPDVADELFFGSQATNLSEQRAYEELKHEIERDADGIEEEIYNEVEDREPRFINDPVYLEVQYESAYQRLGYADRDDYIDTRLELEFQYMQIEEPTISGTLDGVKYEISWFGGAPLLWSLESPVISKARLCSPCVPNAGDLNSLDDDGYECYGVPEYWRTK